MDNYKYIHLEVYTPFTEKHEYFSFPSILSNEEIEDKVVNRGMTLIDNFINEFIFDEDIEEDAVDCLFYESYCLHSFITREEWLAAGGVEW